MHARSSYSKPPSRVSCRLASVSPTPTLAVDARAKALKAAGADVIGFGAGEPDFPTPAHIVEAAVAACRDPANHRYTPVGGLPELRQAIASKTSRDSGYQVEASQVLVTNGAKQAVYSAFAALCDPGDEVLVPAPFWSTYPEAVKLAGGVPVSVPTTESSGFLCSVDQLEKHRRPRTKALVLCSPSNPTGAVYPPDLTAEIGRWAAEHGIWVVADEIYEHLVYDGATAVSLPALVPEAADSCIVINGLSKTYAMTGWRVGWMIGPADVVDAAESLQSHCTSNVANVSQRAALAALGGGLEHLVVMREAFDRRRRQMVQMLSAIPRVSCPVPKGAFYAFPSVAGLLGRSFGGVRPSTTLELAEVVLDQAGVAVVPGEAFGAPGYLRLSYALADEDLVEGISRIAKLVAASQD